MQLEQLGMAFPTAEAGALHVHLGCVEFYADCPLRSPEKTNQTGRASLPFTVLHFAAPLQMDPRTLSFCISDVCLHASLQRMIMLSYP